MSHFAVAVSPRGRLEVSVQSRQCNLRSTGATDAKNGKSVAHRSISPMHPESRLKTSAAWQLRRSFRPIRNCTGLSVPSTQGHPPGTGPSAHLPPLKSVIRPSATRAMRTAMPSPQQWTSCRTFRLLLQVPRHRPTASSTAKTFGIFSVANSTRPIPTRRTSITCGFICRPYVREGGSCIYHGSAFSVVSLIFTSN